MGKGCVALFCGANTKKTPPSLQPPPPLWLVHCRPQGPFGGTQCTWAMVEWHTRSRSLALTVVLTQGMQEVKGGGQGGRMGHVKRPSTVTVHHGSNFEGEGGAMQGPLLA